MPFGTHSRAYLRYAFVTDWLDPTTTFGLDLEGLERVMIRVAVPSTQFHGTWVQLTLRRLMELSLMSLSLPLFVCVRKRRQGIVNLGYKSH